MDSKGNGGMTFISEVEMIAQLQRQVCPKCGSKQADFWRADTPSRHPLAGLITDEIRTFHFVCHRPKCKNRWTVKVHISKDTKPKYELGRKWWLSGVYLGVDSFWVLSWLSPSNGFISKDLGSYPIRVYTGLMGGSSLPYSVIIQLRGETGGLLIQ